MTKIASPHLLDKLLTTLDSPISGDKVSLAMAQMHNGRAPGPNGYSLFYYKTFGDLLIPHFRTAYNDAGEGVFPSVDKLRAFIMVIPKEGIDPLHCQIYQTISLLNVDLKIFTKVLSMRLMELIPQLVHSDQVGFVPSREACDNNTKALNPIRAARTRGTLMLLLSTNAEKAFDGVHGPFLIETLRHVGLGHRMLSWIRAIYSHPSAQVKVNDHFSSPFGIANGMRQGCPVSPDIYPDPGILSPNSQRKPIHLGPPFRWYDVPKNHGLRADFPFKWSETSIKYLGIFLPSRMEDIFDPS